MDGDRFRAAVVEATAAELERVDSADLLGALADGDPTPGSVLRAAADSEHAAHTTFAAWADDEPDERAREAFAAVADRERRHRERVLDAIDGPYEPTDGGVLHRFLRGREGAITRAAAGMVGRGLIVDRTHARLIAFFRERGESRRADLFRDLREETEAGTDRGLDLLSTLCTGERDWADARGVATYAIQVAHDDYADALAATDDFDR